jgi:hypothetical protein
MKYTDTYSAVMLLCIFGISLVSIYTIYSKYGDTTDIFSNQEGLTNIEKQLKCPFNILKNLNKCVAFYLIDVLLFVIWGIVYILCYFIIYLPVLLANAIICFCIKDWFGGCFTIKPNDICPSKKSIALGLETVYNTFTGGNYFYRTKKNIDQCYCTRPIKRTLDPLDKFTSVYSGLSGNSMGTIGATALIVPLGIFVLLYYFSDKSP